MTDQEAMELRYLQHAIRNGTTKIQGCLKEIESITKTMSNAVEAYLEDCEDREFIQKESTCPNTAKGQNAN